MQKLIHEIDLTFPGYFGGVGNNRASIRLLNRCFLDFKQAHFHCLLGRLVVSLTKLAQVTFFTQPSKKPFFPGVHPILANDFGKFPNQYGFVGRFHGLRKQYTWGIGFNFLLLLLNLFSL